MSDETSAAIADDTKLVAGIIRAHFDAGQVRYKSGMTDAELCEFYNGYAMVIRRTLAGRAAASSDLDAIKREAAREALTYVRDQFEMRPALPREIALAVVDMALRNRDPAPVPEPPHVMVNGWRVTWDGAGYTAQKRMGERVTDSSALAVCWAISKRNEADADMVRVLALRHGGES